MKRISSILFACLLGVLTLVGNMSAQTYVGGAGPVDWQDPLQWGIPNYWPGKNNDQSVATLRPTAAVTINNATPAFRVKQFDLQTAFGVTLNGTGTLTIGALNLNTAVVLTIGPGLNVIIDSVIDGTAGSSINVLAGATLTLRKGVGAPNVQVVEGGTVLGAGTVNSTLVIENGFNNGIFPTGLAGAFINPFVGEVQTQGNFLLNDTYTRAAAHAPLSLGGQLTVTAGVTLTLSQTTPNSLIGTGTIQSQVGGIVILSNGFNAGILPGARFANPFFGQLQALGSFIINSSMTIGTANGTAAQQGILNLNAAGVLVGPAPGTTLTLNGTIANALQGNAAAFLMSTAGSTVVLGPGFNAGTVPARLRFLSGALVTQGPLQWNVTGNVNAFTSTGTLTIGGNLSLIGNGAFAITQVGANSLAATGGARISGQGINTIVQFLPNANNGVIPGDIFSNPFDGGITVNAPFNLVGNLTMGTSSGPFTFANQGSVVTIQPGSTLTLNRNIPGAVLGLPISGAAGSQLPGIAYNSYFQGVSASSVLRLGPGFNGGNAPPADAATAGVATGLTGVVPFLPLPFNNTTEATISSFNGKLILDGSITFDRDLRLGAGAALELNGNYTIAAGRALQLYNSGSNTVSGTGFIQGVAPTSAGAPTRHTFGPVGGTALAAVRTAHGSIVELGPGFNGATIPAVRFANPFQGNFDVSSSGNLSIQGDLVLGVPGTVSYLNFNQAAGFQRYDNPVANTLYTTSGTASLLINANSSLRLNGVARASVYGAAANRPGVAPANTIQGTNITSRLIIGAGHGNNNNVYARTTNATFLAAPFNGSLEFDSFTVLGTDATIGVNSQIVLGADLVVTGASIRNIADTEFPLTTAGARNDQTPTGKTLTLLNQGANTITGLGTIQAGTGNTVLLGANANGSILPAARFANPYFGTIGTVSAMTMQGFFTLGGVRDGVSNVNPAAAFVSSGFMALGGKLTVDNGSVLTVSNATVNPIVAYNPLTFSLGQPLFENQTNGTASLDANPTGEIVLMEGLASGENPRQGGAIYTVANNFFGTAAGPTAAGSIPSRSNMRGDVFASPFNGRLTIGASPNGATSRFNLTTGTLTLGPTARLNLVSPLYVSSASAALTPAAFSNGYPRLVLNMTGANSLLGTTTGSFIQSSVGSFSGFANGNNFIISGGNAASATGGTVTLGTGFNAGVLSGERFGDASGFSGRLLLPPTGNFTLTSDLIMMAPSAGSALTPGLKTLNYGILDLGGPSGTTALTVADGITLSLGTTGTYTLNNTGRALQGTGTIQGATNNARVIFNGNSGAAAFTNSMHVTAANLAVPFNGRLEIVTNNTAFVVGNLTIGAPNTANGILNINSDPTVAVPPFNRPLFIPAGVSSIQINNTSPVAVVLPGNGSITSTTNLGSIILGPNALANIIPATQLASPFIGRLIVATTGTGTSGAFALNADLRLANDFASRNAPGARNGYLGVFSPINIASGINLIVQNTSEQSLYGDLTVGSTAKIQGADGNANVRFLAGVFPFAGNNNIVPGTLFATPYNGRVSLESPLANTTGYHLYGGLTLGAAGTSNGFLSVSGATLYLAASTGGTVTGTEATLTINNTLPVEQVLPGGGAIYPKGETGGNANGRNSRWIFGTGSLAGIVPFHKSTNGNALFTATTLPVNSVWVQNGINGTIITPNASVTATNASVSFVNGGTLIVGGTGTASTTAELVLSNAAQRLTIASHHADALSGIGAIRATVTDATVRFGPADVAVSPNAGIIPGANFASNFLGSIAYQAPMSQTGIIRLGDGSATTGRLLALNTAGALYTIGANATLDLRTVTNGVGNTSATAIAGGLVAAAGATSTLILHPNFETNVAVGTPTPSLINQGRVLLASPFNGVLITSTGTTNLNFGNLTIGTTGALEMGGDFVVLVERTLTMNQNTANSFRRTGTTGLLLANPTAAAVVTNPATVVLGPTFNNRVLPVNLLGSTSGVSNEFGVLSATPAIGNPPASLLQVNGGDQLTLSGSSSALTTPANFTVRGDLDFTNAGGGIIIPASTTMTALYGFTAAATTAPVSRGYVQGTNGAGATQSVLAIGAATRTVGNELNANSPTIGGIRNAAVATVPAFTGLLRFLGNGAINGVTVTLGTTSALDLPLANSSLNIQATSTLNMLNQGTNSYTFASGAAINGTAATSSVNLGAGFNGGLLPGAGFTAAGFQGNLTMGGGAAAPGGPLTLSSNLTIGNAGIFNFVGNANKLTLGAFNIVVAGTLSNSGTTQYFVTNGVGTAGLGNVGNVTFPVGPSATVFAPININNNGSPAIFSVRALTAVSQAAPFATGSAVLRQPIVNQQWNVTQNTNVTPGFSVTVTPLWLAGQEAAGFNRSLAVTNAFTTTSGTISSGAGAAASDPNFTGYFRSGVTITQIATNNLNNTPILVSSQPIPAILNFTPPAQSSGATLTITGNRFAPGATVRLGGVLVPAANVTLVPGGTSGIDTLRVIVPSTAASGDVVVTQTGGSSTRSGFTFLGAPLQLPVIRTVTPSPIPAGLGDVEVTITGTAFGVLTPRVVAVGSGITSTITPSANSTTRLVVTVPGNVVRNIGSVVFTVTSLDRLPVSTTVTVSTPPALVLTSLAPASTSGNLRAFTISVNGNNFSAQSLFSLGSTSLRVMGVIRNSDGTLTALVEVPVGAVSGNLNVLNLNGQSASLPFVINSLPRPVITNVSPNILPPGSPNTIITVNGRNLIPGATVSFNGQQLTGVQLTGDSLLTFTIPAALLVTPDLGVLTITNPDGQSIGYRLPVTVGAPGTVSVTGVTPTTTVASVSAFSITINGNGFAGTPRVFLGGQALTVVSTSGNQLVVNVPGNLNIPGTFALQVVNPSGVSSNSTMFTIAPSVDPATLPAINSVTPRSGLVTAGVQTNITIAGINFAQGAVVRLGSVQLAIVGAITANQIVATIPSTINLPATYTLTVTNPNGGVASQAYVLAGTSVSNEPLAGIRVYPNPVVEAVSVEANLERAAKVVITVTNSLGQRVMVVEQNAAAGFFSRSLNINSLPSGAYMVEITDGARRSVEKIIKN
ncbi:MAG: T9SS type A sorting domain-containing protein [Ignavibacteria bacterium]|nr:T9SS type A sorting domain-containing protein [Ignavibacteria bacterium]